MNADGSASTGQATLVARLYEAMRRYHGSGVTEREARTRFDELVGHLVRSGMPWRAVDEEIHRECADLDRLTVTKWGAHRVPSSAREWVPTVAAEHLVTEAEFDVAFDYSGSEATGGYVAISESRPCSSDDGATEAEFDAAFDYGLGRLPGVRGMNDD